MDPAQAARLLGDVALASLGAGVAIRLVVHMSLAGWDWMSRRSPPTPLVWPPVAVLVPAYNEAVVIQAAVRSILACDYPDLRVVVVDDGSTDDTLRLARAIEDPRLLVVASPHNQGKPGAMNLGLAACDVPVWVTVDADTVLRPDALRQIVAHLLADPHIGAVAGNVRVGHRGWLAALQTIEYVASLNLGKRAQHHLRAISTVPGAFGAWRRQALLDVGGVSADTRIEDTDLTLAVAARGWRVVYAPDAVAWTEAPDTLAGLAGQRTRWMSGYLQVIWKYRYLYFRRGTLGWIALPDLAWRNVGSVVLLPLVVPGIVRWVHTFSWTSLLEVLVGALLIDGLALAAAFVMDRERAAGLAWWPLFRLVAPWFFFAILVRVAWRAGRSVPWARPPRRGWSTPPGGR